MLIVLHAYIVQMVTPIPFWLDILLIVLHAYIVQMVIICILFLLTVW